jgi:hypothetical protein
LKRTFKRVGPLLAAVLAALLGAVGAAEAGERVTVPVYVNTTSRWAEGTVGAARNSADLWQYIGCHTAADASVHRVVTSCFAQNSAGVNASCTFKQVAGWPGSPFGGVPLMANNAYISFAWDAAGNCNDFYVEAFSRYEPKKP